jgi:hypothetical protein
MLALGSALEQVGYIFLFLALSRCATLAEDARARLGMFFYFYFASVSPPPIFACVRVTRQRGFVGQLAGLREQVDALV